MPRLLVLAALLVSASSCDSGEPGATGLEGLTRDASLLVGTWEWERSYVCGDRPTGCTEETPRSVGRTETLTFSADGTVSGFFNGYALTSTTYQVGSRYGSGTITLDESEGGAEFGVSRSRLVLTLAPVDGEETTYRRAR